MNKPESDISPLMWVELSNGVGAIHVSTIMTILPDSSNPKKESLIVTSVFTDGITVKGKAEDLVMEWYEQVMVPEEEEDVFDEDDESRHQAIGDLIAEYMSTEGDEGEAEQLIAEASEAFGCSVEDEVQEKQQSSDDFTGLKLV